MAAVYAGDSKSSSTSSTIPAAPPKAEVKPAVDIYHGAKVIDNYRWLEDGNSPETQKWVADEMSYTRALLDPLPGRDAIHTRLTELLSIGSITAPVIAGKHYFYTKREGMQNQPVLYVRDGLNDADRVLVDANQLAADGTIALDWFQPSDNGKYVAYGTSQSGSEISTLHIVETKTGTILPDVIERTRAASIAWLHDNSGFCYALSEGRRSSRTGDVQPPRLLPLARHRSRDRRSVFGEGRDPEDWPSVFLSNDNRWLLIHVSQGWTKSELFLMDTHGKNAPSRLSTGKDFNYGAEVYEGKVYIITNEDAPRYHAFVTDAGNFDRQAWKEIIPQTDAVLQGASVYGGKLFAQYEQNATSQLKIFDLEGQKINDISLPGIGTVFGTGGKWNHDEVFFGFHSFTVPPGVYRVDLESVHHVTAGKNPVEVDTIANPTLWSKVDAPSIDPSADEVAQEWFKSKDLNM